MNTSIFEFVMQIRALNVNNWLHKYDNVEDIKAGLRSQFAYYLLLYAKHLGQTGGEVFRPVTIDGFENGKLVQRRILATEALLLRDAL